jgi:glutamate 5-kinase
VTHSGHLVVDKGAAYALTRRGSSLLPAGIVTVQGNFDRGDTVSIIKENSGEIARGIIRYTSEDLRQIKGFHSDNITERLGYTYGAAVVHRNDMIVL